MLSAVALWALAQVSAAQAGAVPPAPPQRVRLLVAATIVSAAEVRQGRTSEPHQRRQANRDGATLTLIEFE